MNILLIDADKDRKEDIISICGVDNQRLDHAETLEQGLAILNDHPCDVLLIDHALSGIDRIHMLNQQRQSHHMLETAIVILSDVAEPALILSYLQAGAQDCIEQTDLQEGRLMRLLFKASERIKQQSKLEKSHNQLKKLVEMDRLTGLANRYALDNKIKQALVNPESNYQACLILIDLDHFKHVNDNQGHDIGDQLLFKFVKRISHCLSEGVYFARTGGDEFGLFVEGERCAHLAEHISQQILEKLESPFMLNETINTISASIGISHFPMHAQSAEDLFKFSDIALYWSKKNGRNRFSHFETHMHQKLLSRLSLVKELSEAMELDKFSLVYQPIFSAKKQELDGFEALIRWKNAGNKTPDEFIPIAEGYGLIHEIGRWVIQQAFQQLSNWNNPAKARYSMSINLSPVQLSDSNLIDFIGQCLTDYNIRAEWIIFELTETILLDNLTQQIDIIHQISELGCKIALDDFGTGFSSLSHLRNFPIDVVKIDKSIMPVNDRDKNSLCLINGLESMIHSLELDTVAEGVETQLHYDVCRKAGIDKIQGKYFDMPMKAKEIEAKYLQPAIKAMVI